MKKKLFALLAMALLVAMLCSTALAAGIVQSTATVNVRKGPGMSYTSLGRLHEGDAVSYLNSAAVDERGVVWYKIKFDGKNGWVSSKYVELRGDLYVYAVDGQTYLRKYADVDSKALSIFRKGDSALYKGKTAVDDRGVAWYRVEYKGTTGWVSSKYTSFSKTGYDRQIIADDGSAYIRKSADLDATALGILKQDERATYLEKSTRDSRGVIWYKIDYNGIVGWVSSKYCTLR